MNSQLTKIRCAYVLTVAIIALLWSGCDMLEKDINPDNSPVKIGNTKVYIPATGAAYIDLNRLVTSSGAVQFSIVSLPKKGILNDLGKGLLQYSPSTSFTNGKDGFAFSISTTDNKFLKQDSVRIIVENDSTHLPCAFYTANDFVYDPIQGSVLVDVLKNDLLCGASDPLLSIFISPLAGTAQITGSKIQYTPGTGFQGTDRIFYKVVSATDTSKHAYGQVIISAKTFKVFNDSYSFKHDTLSTRSLSLRVFQNDSLYYNSSSPYVVSIVDQPHQGTVSVNGTISLNYVLNQSPGVLTDSLTYKVCRGTTCKSAKVYIRIY